MAQQTEQSPATPQAKVLNGENASGYADNLQPWQAAILTADRYISGCGASVIADTWLVTAAHCVDPLLSDTVIAGTSYILQGATADIDNQYRFNVIKKIRHPDYTGHYDPSSLDHDIALLEVDRSLLNVATPIKIATTAEQAMADNHFANSWTPDAYSEPNLIASGWGDTTKTDLPPNELQVVELSGIPDSLCNTPYQVKDETHFVCADSNDPALKKDVCAGDSGGPLIWQNPTHISDSDKGQRLVGVTSNGPNCDMKNSGVSGAQFNGLYTQVSTYLSWIETELSSQTKASARTGSSGGSVPPLAVLSLAAVGLFRRKNSTISSS